MSRPSRSGSWLERLALALFDVAALCFPARLRAEVGREMRSAFRAALRDRYEERGLGAALVYAVRAAANVVVTGIRERRRWARFSGRQSSRRKGAGSVQSLWMDLRVGARRLRRAPGFAVAAVLMLALAIGANTAVFSALKAVLLAAPPYPDPGRLVWLGYQVGESAAKAETMPWSWAKFRLLEGHAGSALEGVAAYGPRTLTLSSENADPRRIRAEVVTSRYFDVLGLPPVLGRSFVAEETENTGGPLAVVLGNGLWHEQYGSDPGVIGRLITLNGHRVSVVGVAPPGFGGLSGGAQAWVPVPTGAALISPVLARATQAHWLYGFGRLAPGVPVAGLSARLAPVASALGETYPMSDAGDYVAVHVESLSQAMANPASRAAVLALMAAAAMVLLIACANLAGLLLARSRAQARDAAIRLALGAGRGRVVRSVFAEFLVLALAGGGAGLLVARWSLPGIRTIWPSSFLHPGASGFAPAPLRSVDLTTLRLDGTALAFALGATLLTLLLFGLGPALRQSRVALRPALTEGVGVTRHRRGRHGLPGVPAVLVAVQTALALVLLVGAGLTLRSLVRLRRVDVGFDPSHLLVADLSIARGSPAWDDPVPLETTIIDRISALPGVEGATISCPPLNGFCWVAGVTGLDGRETDLDAGVGVHMVDDAFFRTLRIPLRAGRTFAPTDRKDGPPVVVINETAARKLFGSVDPLGHTLALTVDLTSEGRQAEVIGVVGDVLQGRPDQGVQPEAYFSERQMAEAGGALMVRTRGEPLAAVSVVRGAIRSIDRTVVVDRVRTMADSRSKGFGDTRILMILLGIFATVAVALAGAGLWAVVSLTVAERRRELGLRMALGAHARQVVGLVVRQGMAATLVGALLGGWAAWALARLLASLLFRTDSHDAAVFAGAAAVLLLAAVLACLLPARQATRVDPARTLRGE